MSSIGPQLWHKAWQSLPPKYQEILPKPTSASPKDLIKVVEKQITVTKGKPITLPNGSSFFVRDVLEKISHWVKMFIEVGDAAAQYDPVHTALPWAGLRALLQVSINNASKHAAILEGIDTISRWLVWGKAQEAALEVQPHGQLYSDLERSFVQLYERVLVLIARSLKFLRKGKQMRVLGSFFSSDSKFRKDISDVLHLQEAIRACTSQLTGNATLNLMQELQLPISRIETSTRLALNALDRRHQQDILDWVSVVPYEKHHRDLARKTLEGTGAWLFDDPSYFDWQNSSSSEIIWLHGGAGVGKSTLLSMVVEKLIQAHKHIQTPFPLYFYCSRNTAEPERADAGHVIRSLVRQAYSSSGGALPSDSDLETRYDIRKTAGEITVEEAPELFLSAITGRRMTIVCIDALDECSPSSRELLINALETILLNSPSMIKIFVTSREYDQDIVMSMKGYPEVHINANKNQRDVEAYVREKVGKAISKKKFLPPLGVTDSLGEEIIKCLCSGAQGMFRWVELQLEYLYTVRIHSVFLDRLGTLPPGLEQSYHELYDLKMTELGEDQSKFVKRLLSWLLISQRPLSTTELLQLALMETKGPGIANEVVVEICFSLVSLNSEENQFQFSHPSVREFLEKRIRDYQLPVLHDMAESSCLDLIAHSRFGAATDYAATYWPFHAELKEEHRTSTQSGQNEHEARFLSHPSDAFCSWNKFMSHRFPNIQAWDESHPLRRILGCLAIDPHPCFVCVSFGLMGELRRMLGSTGSESVVHLENRDGNRVLFLASLNSQLEVVQLLLYLGAEVNAQEYRFGSALYAASHSGCTEIVELLLDSEADVNAQGGDFGNALSVAAFMGHREVVKLLLHRGADVDARGYGSDTALTLASWTNNRDMVQLLLDKGADVNVQGPRLGDAFCAAAGNGNLEIAKLLLERGADTHCQGGMFGGPLEAASRKGYRTMVLFLLENGVDIDAEDDGPLGRAFYAAASGGHVDVVSLLSEEGDVIAKQGGMYRSAIQAASVNGHLEVVKLLLDIGTEDDMKNVLTFASAGGHRAVVEMLIKNGVILNKPGEMFSCTLLAQFYEKFDDQVLHLLLQDGQTAFELPVDSLGRSFLHSCATYNSRQGIQAAIEYGMDINERDRQQWTPLHWAAWFGSTDAVQLLLDSGANPQCLDWQNWTPERVASFAGHARAKALLSTVANDTHCIHDPSARFRGTCDSCAHGFVGEQHHCIICPRRPGFDLCFRCIRDVDIIHPGHEFTTKFRYDSSDTGYDEELM